MSDLMEIYELERRLAQDHADLMNKMAQESLDAYHRRIELEEEGRQEFIRSTKEIFPDVSDMELLRMQLGAGYGLLRLYMPPVSAMVKYVVT